MFYGQFFKDLTILTVSAYSSISANQRGNLNRRLLSTLWG
jgi:hypothetical protein